ncbi:MAG TPA: Wzz/FepE/Etk N-terminal domain-containing protein [Polyangiales bacterium]|nr:Wzz/FepE/Etk N-terminal domain-containing protein [Polyangiales bacterium]
MGQNKFVDQYDSEDEYRGRPGVPVDFGRLLQAIKRNWRALPIAAAIGALVGLGVAALLIKPSYTSRATIMWEPSSNAEPSDRSFLTQVDSIKLPVNLMEVRKRIGSKARLDELKEKINLLFDGQSHLVVVEVTEPTGKGAAKLANTTVEVFLEHQRKVGMARGRERLQAIETDIEVAQKQLAESREGFESFRKEVGVSDFALETKLAIEKAAKLKQEAEQSNAEAASEEARQRKLSDEVGRVPQVTQSGTTASNPDAIALGNLRTQLVAARAHLAADHPTIIQLEAQVKGLEDRVKNNPTMVQGAVSVSPNAQYLSLKAGLADSKVLREAAAQRQETYRRFAEEAEKRVQQLSEAEGKAQQFTSRIQLLETRLTELETQRVRVRDEVRNAAADFRVVTAAGVPENSNPSKRREIAIRFPLAALVLAFLGILAFELKGLRVHTAREAGFWANAAVIASSTWPREQTTLGVLVDELSDAAPAVRGTTLVVGARVNEVPLAREIAYWLSHLTGWSQRGVVGANQPVVEDRSARGATNVHVAPELGPSNPPAAGTGQALMRRGSDTLTIAQAWDGPPDGPSLRRAARLADRVLVVVAAGTLSVAEVAQLRSRLGRNSGIGLLLVGLNPDFVRLPDRVGEVERFWEARPA